MEKTEKEKKIDDGLIMSSGDDFDPKELADRIHRRVREKISSGFYDQDEIERISKLELEIPDPAVFERKSPFENVTELDEVYQSLNAKWNVAEPITVESPHKGLKGLLTKLYKSILKRLVNPLYPTFIKQSEFNFSIIRYAVWVKEALQKVEDKVSEFSDLRRRYIALSQRVLNLEKTHNEENKRIDTIENRMEDLAVRVRSLNGALRDVDKQGIFIKRRVAKFLDELKTAGGSDKKLAEVAEDERSKLDSFDYMLFENIHRGSREEIKRRLSVYIDWFKGASSVLDVGCGRGEMLELFNENGIEARGVDINGEAVEECESHGLPAVEEDAFSYLRSLPNGSLGGLTAIQFVEHLEVEEMANFFQLAYEKMENGAVIAAETINAACLTTFCSAFYLDLSHVKPIHPLALQFLLERIGFEEVRIEYLNPYPEDIRLSPLPYNAPDGGALNESAIAEYNHNVMKLNNVLYSHTDYAVVGRR